MRSGRRILAPGRPPRRPATGRPLPLAGAEPRWRRRTPAGGAGSDGERDLPLGESRVGDGRAQGVARPAWRPQGADESASVAALDERSLQQDTTWDGRACAVLSRRAEGAPARQRPFGCNPHKQMSGSDGENRIADPAVSLRLGAVLGQALCRLRQPRRFVRRRYGRWFPRERLDPRPFPPPKAHTDRAVRGYVPV